jgi:hypothetical protein
MRGDFPILLAPFLLLVFGKVLRWSVVMRSALGTDALVSLWSQPVPAAPP